VNRGLRVGRNDEARQRDLFVRHVVILLCIGQRLKGLLTNCCGALRTRTQCIQITQQNMTFHFTNAYQLKHIDVMISQNLLQGIWLLNNETIELAIGGKKIVVFVNYECHCTKQYQFSESTRSVAYL